jgi:hypothetical protein
LTAIAVDQRERIRTDVALPDLVLDLLAGD